MALQPTRVNGQWLPNPAYYYPGAHDGQPVTISYCPYHYHPSPYHPCPHHYYSPQPSGYYPPTPPARQYPTAPTPPSPLSPEKDRLTQWIELRQSQGRTVPKSLLARAAKAKSDRLLSTSNKENEIIQRPTTPPSGTPPILPIKSIRKRKRKEASPAIQKRSKPRQDDIEEEDDPEPKFSTIEDITLPGESHDGVAIYDTCDEIRAQLRLHLSMRFRTQAAFLRDAVAAMGSFYAGTTIGNKSLSDFLKRDGPLEGNTCKVYLAAYCYFEKVRILNGRAKTKKRLENEEVWASKGGIERRKLRNHAWCAAGQQPYRDRWGKMHVR